MFKKIFGAAVICFALSLVSFSAFAATNTVTVNSATGGSSATALADTKAAAPSLSRSDYIDLDMTISDATGEITVLVVDANADLGTVSDINIAYIDQLPVASNGNATLSFGMPINVAAGTYAVYIGGTNVSNLNTKYFKIPGASTTYIAGDVDNSGKADNTDAIYILRKGINAQIPDGLVFEAGDVDNSGTTDNTDAIYILRKGINAQLPDGIIVDEQVSK